MRQGLPLGRAVVSLLTWGAAFPALTVGQLEAQAAVPKEAAPQGSPPAPHQIEIRSFQPEQDLADLLEFCASLLQTPIEFNRSEVTGSIGLRLPAPLTEENLWALANRALVARG